MAVITPFGDIKARIEADDQDVDFLVISDSTAQYATEWPGLFSAWLASEYPTHTVVLKLGHIDSYVDAWTVTGTGSHTITCWNASGGGWRTAFFLEGGAQNHLISDVTGTVRHTIVAMGHNETDPIGSRFTDLYAVILADHPSTSIGVSSQNPGTTAHQARTVLITDEAHSEGYRTYDIMDAWIALGDYSAYKTDVTHPNQAGQDLWASMLEDIWVSGDVNMANVMNRAEGLWQAREYAGVGNWLDESGNGHNAVNSNSIFLTSAGGKGVYIPNDVAGTVNLLYGPLGWNAARITGDIDVRVDAAADDWALGDGGDRWLVDSRTQNGLGGYGLYQHGWGTIRLAWGAGSAAVVAISTATLSGVLADGARAILRATLDVDNGAGGYEVEFFYSVDDGVSWVQLGATVVGGTTTSIAPNTNDYFEVGSQSTATGSHAASAIIYGVQVLDGIDGTPVIDIRPQDAVEPYASFTDRITGDTITIVTGTVNHATAFTDHASWLRAVDDYHEIPDQTNLDFAATDDFTLMRWVRVPDATPVSDQVWIAKKVDVSTAAGYCLYLDTSGVPTLVIGDGSASTEATGPALTAGIGAVVTAVRDTTADTITVYTDGVAGTPVTDTTTATLANAEVLRFGRLSGAGTAYENTSDFADVVWREALTAAEILAAGKELLGLGGTHLNVAGPGQLLQTGG